MTIWKDVVAAVALAAGGWLLAVLFLTYIH